ncbi:hypothetical protein D018_5077B, partial [Vibrio parahaemolyticus VP2007-007]
GNFSCQ